MKSLLITIAILLSSLQITYAQTKAFKKQLKKQDAEQKKNFPDPLVMPFPTGSLGEKIQELYEIQAEESCGIIRSDKRLYIPNEIISGYGDSELRSTKIFDIDLSATNLLFLALLPSDITKIIDGTFNEQESINAKRIVGINDKLINFGQSILSPINGFPSLFYQKSCGSYFVGKINTQINAPVAELKASLEAETKKSTSITTVTGNFFSPLYLILKQNTAQSTYAHLLLWEIYLEQLTNNPATNEYLYEKGKYISEFNATMTYRAINSEQSINMNGRFSSNLSMGAFSANGNINLGNENKVSFDLKDFRTFIHKLSNGNLSWDLTDLPKIDQINQKLQNSLDYKVQPSITEFATHLLPTDITRILVGIPASLCNKYSWEISPTGYNSNTWKEKPSVVSTHVSAKENNLPECICNITGFIKKEAIDKAVKANEFIDLSFSLDSKSEIANEKLSIKISATTVKVTDNPKISNINSESLNAFREERRVSNRLYYNYPIQFTINATGIKLTEPYQISNIQIEYVNKENENQPLSIIDNSIRGSNFVKFDIQSSEKPNTYTSQGEIIIPIKIKFNIEIKGGTTTQLVTNTINLNLPDLVNKIPVSSNLN